MTGPQEATGAAGNAEQASRELIFSSLEEFVADYLTKIVERRLNRSAAVWCPDWWRHPEALARLSVLWRAFEFLKTDQTLGLSTWWLHHADPHLRALMDPTFGPFVACDPRKGHSSSPPEPLPSTPVPQEIRDHPSFGLSKEDLERVERRQRERLVDGGPARSDAPQRERPAAAVDRDPGPYPPPPPVADTEG